MKPIEIIVDQQIKRWELEKKRPDEVKTLPPQPGLIITISRQRGSGGSIVAERLAQLTGFTLFHRDIIDRIAQEIGTQKRLVESLDEADRSNLELWVDGILRGRIVDSSDYLKSLVKIIGVITRHGKAIIVGRGANFIVGSEAGFHVRIVADLAFRVNSLKQRRGFSDDEAGEDIDKTDQNRRKFIKSHFNRDINDPTAYDLVINSTYFNVDKIVAIIMSTYPQKRYDQQKFMQI